MKTGKKNITRIVLSILLMTAFCPSANAGSSQKFEFLLRFFDLNEAAFAYHRHCLSRAWTRNISKPKFWNGAITFNTGSIMRI